MITSAKTARNILPAIFRKVDKVVGWQTGDRNIDYGGGPYSKLTMALADKGVDNLVYDPHHKSAEHNLEVLMSCNLNPADTATLSNVLNVIPNLKVRLEVIREVKSLLSDGGMLFVTVYEGDRSGKGKKTRDGWQENRRLNTYRKELSRVFDTVRLVNGLLICY